MSPLFETVKVLSGKLFNLEYHNSRMNKTRRELFNSREDIRLEEILEIPDYAKNGLFKCRIVYDNKISKIEWSEYLSKKIEKLKIVEDNEIEYSYKFFNRTRLNELLNQKTESNNEEILIVKNGLVTDTSYTNIVLFNGKEWHTPAKPLLRGAQRQKLLAEDRIIEKEITLNDLMNYKTIKLINAMMEFDDAPTLSIKSIIKQR